MNPIDRDRQRETTLNVEQPEPQTDEADLRDGRQARSRRTIELILTAFLELVEREGHLRPTAQLIARRAGVSRRGLYLHFETVEDLLATAAERRSDQMQAAWQAPPHDAPFDERIGRFCHRWGRMLELVNPVQRAAAIYEPSSHRVAASVDRNRRWARSAVESAFRPELSTVSGRDRTTLVVALHQATSCSGWSDLRRDGCDVEEATEAMGYLLTALFEPAAGRAGTPPERRHRARDRRDNRDPRFPAPPPAASVGEAG
jgi:TetR/AcrR family transcriptional regulator, regulator of autoinduction and epiphytic fitness